MHICECTGVWTYNRAHGRPEQDFGWFLLLSAVFPWDKDSHWIRSSFFFFLAKPAGRWVLGLHLSLPSKCIARWVLGSRDVSPRIWVAWRFPCRGYLGDKMRKWSSLRRSRSQKVCLCGISGACPWDDLSLQEPSRGACLLRFCSIWEGFASNSHAVGFFLPWFHSTHPDSPEFRCKLFSVVMTCDFSLWKCNHAVWPFDLGSTAASCTFRLTCQRWDSNCTWNSQEGCFFAAPRSNHFHTHYFQLNFKCLLLREMVLCWGGLLLRPEMSMFTVWIA